MSARVLRALASLPLTAGLLLAGTLLAAGPGGALETSGLGISPAGEADNFHLELLPGESAARRAIVTNRTGQHHRVLVYPVDATVTTQGGFALGQRDAASRGLAAWMRLPVSELSLAPHSTVPLPFHLTVPADAAPGDYTGGIVIEMGLPGQAQDVGDGFAVQMNLVQRIGVRIYLTLAGQAHRGVHVGQLTSERTGDGIRFSVPVTNTGNVRLESRAHLGFKGFRLPPGLEMSRVETLLPGSTVALTALWRDPPLVAAGTATATVDFGDAQPQRRSTHLRLLPLPLLAAALLGLALVTVGTWRFVRFVRRARVALRLAGDAAGPKANPPVSA
jgi:hypothetical protein